VYFLLLLADARPDQLDFEFVWRVLLRTAAGHEFSALSRAAKFIFFVLLRGFVASYSQDMVGL